MCVYVCMCICVYVCVCMSMCVCMCVCGAGDQAQDAVHVGGHSITGLQPAGL